MIFSNERIKLRQLFFDAWEKHQTHQPCEPLEKQLLAIILEHPEYHYLFSNKDKYLDKDYLPEAGETNPFLHMSIHMSIREQLNTNRPQGITKIFNTIQLKKQNAHETEHAMMDVFAELMWEAQQQSAPPDETRYLQLLKEKLLGVSEKV